MYTRRILEYFGLHIVFVAQALVIRCTKHTKYNSYFIWYVLNTTGVLRFGVLHTINFFYSDMESVWLFQLRLPVYAL